MVTLLDLEEQGVRLELAGGGRFRVMPMSVLTPADRAFLTARRDEVRAIVNYYSSQVTRHGAVAH